ncbi:aldo/keto reductase [uncultured Bartonella sp.]|uniref:aldo/keto reductase n=1 Tax=uncultured Bartonella sp. TaxID=104108 RepID=UPI0025D1864B|nr:aldo/keto reductase [uncultured Bartonella sp.]
MNITRRQFAVGCGAGLLVCQNALASPTTSPQNSAAPDKAATNNAVPNKTTLDKTAPDKIAPNKPAQNPLIKLKTGNLIPALGMGTWKLAQGVRPIEQEEEALQTGLDLGMKLIDTAELYGSGLAEEMVGRVIAGRRNKTYIVSKIMPAHAGNANDIRTACQNSLARLGIAKMDLYLLHWRGGLSNLKTVVDTFEELKAEGAFTDWGVSNFSVADMEDLFAISNGEKCATNQVEYSLLDRQIERDLMPWSIKNAMPIMAYSPLGSGKGGLLQNTTLQEIAKKHAVSAAAVAISWTMRNNFTISIPQTGQANHMRENAAALGLHLDADDLEKLDKAFPI